MAYRIANYTAEAMIHLAANEFSTPEREQRLGVLVGHFFLPSLFFRIYSPLVECLALAGMAFRGLAAVWRSSSDQSLDCGRTIQDCSR